MFRPLADFADQHVDLDTVFRSHQVALMSLDLTRARERLSQFSSMLSGHMGVEEEILIPAFAERVGEMPRLGPDMVREDHKKLLDKLKRVATGLEELVGRESVTHEDVLDLFDLELSFKRLLHHHDERERAGLFATLDESLSEDELQELWKRVEAFKAGHAERSFSRQRR
jgi:hemerythrin-like domain-containing protein